MIVVLLLLLSKSVAGFELPESTRIVSPLGYPMVAVPSGVYEIGCTPSQQCPSGSGRKVQTKDFLVGEIEVTRGLYKKVAGGAPYYDWCQEDSCPAVSVSWVDAIAFANAMSRKEGIETCYTVREGKIVWWPEECYGYRLPTADEWEIAARGGHDFFFAGSNHLNEVAVFDEDGDVFPVGRMKPNGYGLFDMTGNVYELVLRDGKRILPLEKSPVLLAGGWTQAVGAISDFVPLEETARYRGVGFRLVRTIQTTQAPQAQIDTEPTAEIDSKKGVNESYSEELAAEAFLGQAEEESHVDHKERKSSGDKSRNFFVLYAVIVFILPFGALIAFSKLVAPMLAKAGGTVSAFADKRHQKGEVEAKPKSNASFVLPRQIDRGEKVYLLRTKNGFSVVKVEPTGEAISEPDKVQALTRSLIRELSEYNLKWEELHDVE